MKESKIFHLGDRVTYRSYKPNITQHPGTIVGTALIVDNRNTVCMSHIVKLDTGFEDPIHGVYMENIIVNEFNLVKEK